MERSPAVDEEADVLVVERDADRRQRIARMLEAADNTVCQAEDGFAAMAKLRSMRVGAVVLDPAMPVLDGFSILAHFDGELPPVILLSPEGMFHRVAADEGSPVFAVLYEPGISPLLPTLVAVAHEAGGWRRCPGRDGPRSRRSN